MDCPLQVTLTLDIYYSFMLFFRAIVLKNFAQGFSLSSFVEANWLLISESA